MKKLFIIANWKANKTEEEALIWFEEIKKLISQNTQYGERNKEIVVCPPYTLLAPAAKFIKRNNLLLRLGSQDISLFGRGAYTGEVPGSLFKEYAAFCIIGHSERRKYFHEDDETVTKKVEIALEARFLPIVCVQGKETPVPKQTIVVAYEPIWAIGSGHPDTPENANEVAKKIKENNPSVQYVLYGGSVIPENVHDFTQMENISGALVGGASLDPEKFFQIIQNA